MKKKKTLRKNYEFKKVLTKGKMYAGEQILIYISQNKLNENLIGIAISSKLCNAVKRNTIKRKSQSLRNIWSLNRDRQPTKQGCLIFLRSEKILDLYIRGVCAY